MLRILRLCWLICAIGVSAPVSSLMAQDATRVPNLLDLQGFLRTQSGQPVNKMVSMTVSLYDAPDGGTLLYSETIPAVQVVGGRFSLQLGKVNPIPSGLFNNPQVFVGVSVDGSPELPRQQLVTAPYAFVAQSAVNASFARSASSLDCSGCVTTSNLGQGVVTTDKIGAACSPGQILKRLSSGWGCAEDEGVLYSAGEGLVLQGTEFSLDTAFTDARYVTAGKPNSVTGPMLQPGSVTADKIGEPCAVGQVLKKTASGWSCSRDESNIYTGADFVLSGQSCPSGQVVKGAQADGTLVCVTDKVNVYTGNDFALSNQFCPPGFVVTGIQSNGLPQCEVDNVGPTYVAGPGIQFVGNKISLLQTCTTGSVLKWNEANLTWECAADNDTHYQAGTGLVLQNTVFSADQQQITAWARDACFDTNDEVLSVVAAAGYMKRGDPLDESAMPPGGLNEVSNDLLWNEFTEEFVSPNVPILILDNNPVGVMDTINVPDVGTAEQLLVRVDIETSNTNQIEVRLYDPLNQEYVLHRRSGNSQTLQTSYPVPTPTVSGDLTYWVGRNPQGTWRIRVIDTQYLNNTWDGRLKSWSIAVQTLSNKKVRVAGSLLVTGDLTVSGKTDLQGDVGVSGQLAFGASGSPYLDADRVNKLTGGPGAWGMTAGVIYERKCTWTWFQGGTTAIGVSSCTPPPCGSGHIDLGVNEYARTGALDYDSWWQWTSQAMGTSERLCLIPPNVRATVYVRTCSWANSSYNCNCDPSTLISSCTPPACRPGDTDLGTQNIVADISKHTDYSISHDQISVVGWTERLCLITLP